MPSFVTRVPRADRGGRWIEYLRERGEASASVAARLGLATPLRVDGTAVPSVRLLRTHGTEDELLAALVYESAVVDVPEAHSDNADVVLALAARPAFR